MRTRKTTIKWFVDFDKEEKYLNDMAGAGWEFWHTNGVIYRFRKCAPGEFIYQIDFDEERTKKEVGDYVLFRSQCGDNFVHQWKHKLYWRREAVSGPFETQNNVAASLRQTSKAFNFHLKSLIGLTLLAAVAFLVLMPLGRYLPQSSFSQWLFEFSCGLTYGILLAEVLILLPVLRKLRLKMNSLIGQMF